MAAPVKKPWIVADSETMPPRPHQPVRATSSVGRDPGAVPGRSNARRVSIGLLVVGLAITTVATLWSVERGSRSAAEEVAGKGGLLVYGIQEALGDAEVQILAGGSLFRSSDHVSPDEFEVFVTDIGLMPGILGLGYVPVVADEQLSEWMVATRAEVPALAVFELDEDKLPVPIEQRDLRFPLLHLEPFDLFSSLAGLDLGYHEDWYDDLVDGLGADGITMTSFVELGLPAPLDDEDQFIIGWPIADLGTGEVDALVVALLDLGMLIDGNISDEITEGIVWEIADVSGGGPPPDESGQSWTGALDFGSRTWMFTVTTASPATGLLNGAAMVSLLGGLALTILLATVGQLAVSRASGTRRVEALESLNDSKDEFLAAVSHRLRTPLTAVVGFSEVLNGGDVGLTEADRRELLATIAVQAIELGHLFDNLLTVTRDTSRAMFSPSRVSVVTELHAVLDTVEPARRAKVRVVAADPEVVAAGDPGLVRQILRNLVANATDFGDQVELTVLDEIHIARIVVRDNGPGVPPHRVGSIFDLYDNSSDDRGQPKSMGVGLFVSRRLARRMSGDITYRRADSWTVFELSLPALPAPAPVDLSSRAATAK